jgi:thiaminase
MCTDFTDLNKCCPKDNFPVVRIDQIIDAAAGSEMVALLDCFSGYHQIWLHEEDEEKTSFITPFGTYCYLRMSKGLRNAGSTFCRMIKDSSEGSSRQKYAILCRRHSRGQQEEGQLHR